MAKDYETEYALDKAKAYLARAEATLERWKDSPAHRRVAKRDVKNWKREVKRITKARVHSKIVEDVDDYVVFITPQYIKH